jgi:hypothetical protein
MFSDEIEQYVNIKQYDKQLKIDTKILKNKKVDSTSHSSFIVEDKLGQDVIDKLNILQSNTAKTYLSTVLETSNQKVLDSHVALEQTDEDLEVRKLGGHLSVAVSKDDLEAKKDYFSETGCDYIFSPFNILYNNCIEVGINSNSLNILILNNKIFGLIFDENKNAVFGDIRDLTAFEQIQTSEFYTDDLEGQELYDQIHTLELQDSISSLINQFYEESSEETFIQNVAIFYIVKQLDDDRLAQLNEELMLEIEYFSIDFNKHLFEIAQSPIASKQSFIAPREKKNKQSFGIWIVAAVLSIALVGGVLYYMKVQEEAEKARLAQEEKARQIALKKAKLAAIKLPNHIDTNDKIVKNLLTIFDIIPYSVILNELQVQKRDSTLVCTMLEENIFIKNMQQKFLTMYDSSEMILSQKNDNLYNVIVANTGIKTEKKNTKSIEINYKRDKFINKNKFESQIKALLPRDAVLTFKSKSKNKYLTYNYSVSMTSLTPQEFFDFVESLNKKTYSININYPIEFAKTNKGLEVLFGLQFHQFSKK